MDLLSSSCLKVILFFVPVFKMAYVIYGILHSNVHPVTGESYETAAPDDEAFLRNVITPIYQVLRKAILSYILGLLHPFTCMFQRKRLLMWKKESKRNEGGTSSHSRWRNYDDLNEYFWWDRWTVFKKIVNYLTNVLGWGGQWILMQIFSFIQMSHLQMRFFLSLAGYDT